MVLFGFQLKDLKVVLQFCHETQIKIEMKVKKKKLLLQTHLQNEFYLNRSLPTLIQTKV